MAGATPPQRPPELVAATERPVELVGEAASVELTVPSSTQALLERAFAEPGATRTYLNVEDIEAERNPGVVYGVYVNLPSGERQHVGNIALFGIESMNDPDKPHDGVPGFRHTFDVTSVVKGLRDAAEAGRPFTVTFEPILPLSPPGGGDDVAAALAEQTEWAASTPVRIGRVSLFVG